MKHIFLLNSDCHEKRLPNVGIRKVDYKTDKFLIDGREQRRAEESLKWKIVEANRIPLILQHTQHSLIANRERSEHQSRASVCCFCYLIGSNISHFRKLEKFENIFQLHSSGALLFVRFFTFRTVRMLTVVAHSMMTIDKLSHSLSLSFTFVYLSDTTKQT